MGYVLVTGGAGFIGSHAVVALSRAGLRPIIFDNLSNAKTQVLERINALAGTDVPFVKGDVRSRLEVDAVFEQGQIDAVINFAGLKAVGESVLRPLDYYVNNVGGAATVLSCMLKHGCTTFVFSSSATVFGQAAREPLSEESPIGRANCPYGQTKIDVELMCEEFQRAHEGFSMVMLRYFNPVGAHESGLIGEDPNGVPRNLMPCLTQVAVGRLPCLDIYGNDYPTPDGTCVRDYIHVTDLANGLLAALRRCVGRSGFHVYNFGTGRGYSVLEVVRAFSEMLGRPLPYRFVPRRPGDVAWCLADPAKARRELGWKAELDLPRMVRDAYRFQQMNPKGYAP